jgi:hypothetical protein
VESGHSRGRRNDPEEGEPRQVRRNVFQANQNTLTRQVMARMPSNLLVVEQANAHC